jgi:hypothetical protein
MPNPCNLDDMLSGVHPVDDPAWLRITSRIAGSPNSGTIRPDSGKSANLSTAWNRLLTNRSAAEALSSAIKAAKSLMSNLAVGDQISLKAIL